MPIFGWRFFRYASRLPREKKCVTSLTSSWLCRLCSYQIKYIIYYTLAETYRFGDGGGTKTVWKAYDSGVNINAK